MWVGMGRELGEAESGQKDCGEASLKSLWL